ncbi:unnamed protein product, partial [Mesorhabditis spiculigera]
MIASQVQLVLRAEDGSPRLRPKLSGEWTQVEVVRLEVLNGGLGFGIVGGTSTGVVVKTILPGSPANKDQRLRSGDHILQVGNINTQGMTSQQVATILRQQENLVEMIVGRPINGTEKPEDTADCWTMATKSALNPSQLEEERRGRRAHLEPTTSEKENEPTSDVPEEKPDPAEPEPEPSASQSNAPQPPTSDSRKNSTPHNTPPSTSGAQSIAAESRKSSLAARHSEPAGSPISPTMSLKALQEMALTVFLRENWENAGKYDVVEVELGRHPTMGLGITVAGYVHRKEEIGGVFVKSLVKGSAALRSKLVHQNDLILKVNGESLEHLSHADSVKTLVRSGQKVALSLVRFHADSPQALCLNMLQRQETETQVIDVQSSDPELVAFWKQRIEGDVDIIQSVIRPDRGGGGGDGGLGVALEGTVDVVEGTALCPHHYIGSIRRDGPAAGLLQAGDELLQVNHVHVYGESHVTVRDALARAVSANAPVTLVIARKAETISMWMPSGDAPLGSLPQCYPLLASASQQVTKAKSDPCLPSCSRQPDDSNVDEEYEPRASGSRMRARSLEPLTGLAVWECVPVVVWLHKDSRGLGFSVADYKDPRHPASSVVVVRSLVPGGVAQADGRIVPGDRLLSVNKQDLSCASLERAVAVLKAAPMGSVRLCIAKPVPVDERSMASMTSWSPCSSRSVSPASPMRLAGSWAYDVIYLPAHLERTIKVQKGPVPLGITVDAERDKGVNGCVVKSICGKKAIARDGRLQVGDYIVKINHEPLRNSTSSQARAILKRTNLVGTNCTIIYITGADAKIWKERFAKEAEPQTPELNRLSPRVFPKFYRGALDRKPSVDSQLEVSTAISTSLTEAPPTPAPTSPSDAEVEQLRQILNHIIDELLAEVMKQALQDSALQLDVLTQTPDWSTAKRSKLSKKKRDDAFSDKPGGWRTRARPPPLEKKRMRRRRARVALMRSKLWGEARTVILNREPDKSFGISIVGGRVEVSQKGGLPGTGNTVSGIFIKSVLPNSPAGQSGQINMGDRVLSVNEVDLREASHEEAVAAIRSATNPVKFVLQSLHSFAPHQQMISSTSSSTIGSIRVEASVRAHEPMETVVLHHDQVIVHEEKPKPIPKKQPSVDSSEVKPSVQRQATIESKKSLQSRVSDHSIHSGHSPSLRSIHAELANIASTSEAEVEPAPVDDPIVDGVEEESAAYLRRRPSDCEAPSTFGYTRGKIDQKYSALPGEVLFLQLRGVPEAGLGISLADSTDRLPHGILVISTHPACPLPIRPADEILEVNGKVLVGLSPAVASGHIRTANDEDYLELLVLRRPQPEPLPAPEKPEAPPAPAPVVLNGQAEPKEREQPTVRFEDGEKPEKAQPTVPPSPRNDRMRPPTEQATLSPQVNDARKKSVADRAVEIATGKETVIEIDKEGKGLGLSIVGGIDTVLGTVVIHEVYPDGAAAADGRLRPGDQVLEVNNQSLRNVTHETAIQHLRRTPNRVKLQVYRDVNLQRCLLDPTQIYNIIELELTKKPGRGLGLSIVGRKNEAGVYVSEVVRGGAAEADHRLFAGDQILAVNGTDVANLMQEEVAAMLKACVGKVTLKVGRWKVTEATDKVHAAAEAARATTASSPREEPPAAAANRPLEVKKADRDGALSPLAEEPIVAKDVQPTASAKPSTSSLMPKEPSPQPSSSTPSNVELLKDLKEEGSETILVELRKQSDQQLGMGIGKRSRGILVTSLQPGSAAAEKLKVGDRILAVNALPVTDQVR